MQRKMTVLQTNAGTTKFLPLDYRARDFRASIFCRVVSGSPDYTVEVTDDDVQSSSFVPASANVQPHASLAALTASAKGNLAFPASAIRLKVNSGTGVVQMDVIEGGVA